MTPKTKKPQLSQREIRKAEMLQFRLPPYSWTLQMIADHFKVSKQRVQQIIGKTSRYGTVNG